MGERTALQLNRVFETPGREALWDTAVGISMPTNKSESTSTQWLAGTAHGEYSGLYISLDAHISTIHISAVLPAVGSPHPLSGAYCPTICQCKQRSPAQARSPESAACWSCLTQHAEKTHVSSCGDRSQPWRRVGRFARPPLAPLAPLRCLRTIQAPI